MYNLYMFYQYSYAVCFDHNFGYHQTLNEHISNNQTHWIQGLMMTKIVVETYSITILVKHK
jgi:hypothetical protein